MSSDDLEPPLPLNHPEPLGRGLTDAQLSLRPFCYDCNWRKGGVDSWNGAACKCGHQARTFRELFGMPAR